MGVPKVTVEISKINVDIMATFNMCNSLIIFTSFMTEYTETKSFLTLLQFNIYPHFLKNGIKSFVIGYFYYSSYVLCPLHTDKHVCPCHPAVSIISFSIFSLPLPLQVQLTQFLIVPWLQVRGPECHRQCHHCHTTLSNVRVAQMPLQALSQK